MPSAFDPNTILQDGTPAHKPDIRTGLIQLRSELNAGGFVTDPTTGTEATGSAALAAMHADTIKHSEYNFSANQPDGNVTYNQAEHGFFPQFRYSVLTADRELIFPASQGRAGATATILNRAAGFNIVVQREDPDNPGDPAFYATTNVGPNYTLRIRKDQDGPGNWTNLGEHEDGANFTSLSSLSATNLTSGTVPSGRINVTSLGTIGPYQTAIVTSGAVSAAGAITAANSVAASGGLVGDVATPGADKLYGTDGAGARGWYAKPSAGAVTSHAASHAAGQSDAVALAASQITSGTFANALFTAGNITQFQGSLTLSQSQVTGLATLLSDLQSQITALKTEEFTGEPLVSGTGTFIIDRRAAYAYTIDRWSGYTSSGSVTANLSVDDTTITGSTVTPNGSESTATITASNRLVPADATLRIHVTATSGTTAVPVKFAWSILKVRV